jgi:hypothetical protein
VLGGELMLRFAWWFLGKGQSESAITQDNVSYSFGTIRIDGLERGSKYVKRYLLL